MTRSEAESYRLKIENAATFLDDETALVSIELFPKWDVGILYSVGQRIAYNDKLYKCVQLHLSQADWTPDATPALWVEVSIEEWEPWRQPTGAHDAYPLGAKVSHVNKHWISNMDGNIWEPGVVNTWDEA